MPGAAARTVARPRRCGPTAWYTPCLADQCSDRNGRKGSECVLAVWGNHTPVPVLGGGSRPFINLDNAASTPVLKPVRERVDQFLSWYSSVHRGAGFKSQLASRALDEAPGRA